MATCKFPSFVKVLKNPSSSYLPLPPAFVKKHMKTKIPKKPTLKIDNGEVSWRLKIEKIDGFYCFTHGWKTVVQDAQLGLEDILVFWLIDPFTFQVSIYGPNECQKDVTFKYNANELCDCCGKARTNLVPETQIKIEDEDEDNQENDGDEEDENDDDDVKEEKEEDVIGHSFFDFSKKIIEKRHKNEIRLPPEFLSETGIKNKKSIKVQGLDGKEFMMSMKRNIHRSTDRHLTTGWPDFRKHNKITDGDICLFRFIKGKDILILTQLIKRNQESQKKSDGASLKGEKTPEKAKMRKRGRPPLQKPQSVEEKVNRKRGRPPLKERHYSGGEDLGVVDLTNKKERPQHEKRYVNIKTKDEVVEVVKSKTIEGAKRKRGRPPLKKHCSGGDVNKKKGTSALEDYYVDVESDDEEAQVVKMKKQKSSFKDVVDKRVIYF